MIFPKNIIGPQFEKGDLVSFHFNGAELTFRAPIIPKNDQNIDEISPLKDLRNINTEDWSRNDQGRPCIQLAQQMWAFEDAHTLDDIAQCSLYVSLIEITQQHTDQNILLTQKNFDELMLSWMDYSFAAHEEFDESNQSLRPYKITSVEKQYLNWLKAQVRFTPETSPSPICVMTINHRFVVMVSLEIESLHYASRSNPYSEETLKQFERDLFDDFLSHIKIEYSPELIEKIQSLKSKTPA